METTHLKQHTTDQSIDGRQENSIRSLDVEEDDSTLGEDGEEIEHFLMESKRKNLDEKHNDGKNGL